MGWGDFTLYSCILHEKEHPIKSRLHKYRIIAVKWGHKTDSGQWNVVEMIHGPQTEM